MGNQSDVSLFMITNAAVFNQALRKRAFSKWVGAPRTIKPTSKREVAQRCANVQLFFFGGVTEGACGT